MPTFRYRAYGAHGELAEGRIEAASQDAASDLLWVRGLTPFQMRTADSSTTPWWRRELLAGQGSRHAELATFTRELATLGAAEIPLDDTLRIVCEQAISPRMRSVSAVLLAHGMD